MNFIIVNRNGLLNDEHVIIGSSEIKTESCVKLLHVYFDQQLTFSEDMDELCRKVGKNCLY